MRATRISLILAISTVLLLTSACGSTSSQGRQGDPDRISAEQMEQAAQRHDTAHSVVRSLRPLWLRKRGQRSIENPAEIIVYIDGSRYANPGALQSVQAIDVASMEYLSPEAATNRYGAGHIHGAILVHTKNSL